MGFMATLERRSSPEDPRTSLDRPAAWLWDALGSSKSQAGVKVSEQGAMRFSAVFACVRILAESMAQLPLPVYRRLAKGREQANDHPLYPILHDRPNPELSSFNWRELMQTHLGLWGNAWAEKEEAKSGRLRALWPLMPNVTRAERKNGRKLIVTQLPDGREIALPAENVLHIPGMGFNGLQGFSPIRMQMQAVGLGLAAEEFGARFYGQGATVAGVLTHQGNLSELAQKRLRESFQEVHSGVGNSHRLVILEEAMKYEKIGIPPEEAQFLQLRKFQVNEICRFYRIPPHMVADLDRPFQSNVEQMGIDFVRQTLGPWFVRWEQVLNWELFPEAERRAFYAEFNAMGFLRGDSAARAQYYTQMFNIGALNQNEIREDENRNPIEGGDTYFVPLNMIPLDMAKDGPPEPEPVSEPTDDARTERVESRGRGLLLRQRVVRAHQRLFLDAGTRVVRREVEAAKAVIKKVAGDEFGGAMRRWMEKFYPDHRQYVVTQMQPVVEAMGAAVWAAAAGEVGKDTDLTPEAERFLREYTETLAASYVGRSQGQIEGILNADGTGPELAANVDQRLSEWMEKRPEKVARYESVKLGSAVAKAMWAAAGISTLRWAAGGSACPICQEMDGRVVSIERPFVKEGEHVGQLTTRHDFAHPPLHEGCTCGIIPG